MGLYPHIRFATTSRPPSPTFFFTLTFLRHPHTVTLCVNAGFYLGAGNSANSSIAYPWLLSIEAFAGARLVLNLHTLPFDASSVANSRNGGTLSSHIVFMSNPAASSTTHARTAATRWDWGGLREHASSSSSYGSRSGDGSGSGSGTRVMESYEMTLGNASTSMSKPGMRHGKSASSTTRYSDTCVGVEIEQEGVP